MLMAAAVVAYLVIFVVPFVSYSMLALVGGYLRKRDLMRAIRDASSSSR